MPRTALFPGSFDPVTNGHLDLIHRGAKLFDRLIVAIAPNLDKGQPLFELAERKEMLEAMTAGLDNVSVDIFEGLLVRYCIQKNANAVLRGIRAVSGKTMMDQGDRLPSALRESTRASLRHQA